MNSQTLIAALGWTLVNFLWQGCVIASVLAVALRLMRRAAAHHRYLAGCAALILMLGATTLTFRQVAAQYSAVAPESIEFADAPTPLQAAPANSSVKKLNVLKRSAAPVRTLAERLETFFPLVVLGWLLGVFALSCRLLGGWLQIKRLKRSAATALDDIWHRKLAELAQRLGLRKPVRLWQSALVEVPTVIGWLRPVILLPASCLVGLAPAQLESILAHELAHIRRHDYLVNLLQSVVETILFYHPAVWWVSRRVREERENCCDDLAVEVCGDRVGYARALATLEELRLAPAPLAMAAAGSPLLPRIRRLVGRTPGNLNRPVWPLAGMVALVLMTSLAFGLRGNRAVAEENSTSATNFSTSDGSIKRKSNASNAPAPSLANNTNPSKKVISGKGRQAILSKLALIEVDSLQFDHVPLTEVIKKLAEIAKAQDPDHFGINFYVDLATASAPRIDPASGLPLKPLGTNWTDIKAITVNINPPLNHIKLTNALDAITKSADHPLRYNVLDYAVVFSLKDPNEVTLEMRRFQVDTNVFKKVLERYSSTPDETSASGVNNLLPSNTTGSSDIVYDPSNSRNRKASGPNNADPMAKQIRLFLADAGIDFDTNKPANVGKAFVYSNRKGVLLIRATHEDLDKVQAAITQLSPRQVNLKVKFIEMDLAGSNPADRANVLPMLKSLDYDKASPEPILSTTVSTNGSTINTRRVRVTSGIVSQVSGILSKEQFAKTIDKLEQMNGVDELNAPQVTTESGRQAQVQAVDIESIVTGMAKSRDSQGKVKYQIQNERLPFGPVADLLPRVSADDKMIAINVVATVTEFLVYSDPTDPTKTSLEKPRLASGMPLPLPHFRMRQMTTDANVLDGQTLVLAGLEPERVMSTTNKVFGGFFHTTSQTKTRKILFVFITPTVINPDGTLFHATNAPLEMRNGKIAK